MAKADTENKISNVDDGLLRKIRVALVEVCLLQLDDVKNKRLKNPEVVINSAIEIYNTLKNESPATRA